jgi:hypothetical protein
MDRAMSELGLVSSSPKFVTGTQSPATTWLCQILANARGIFVQNEFAELGAMLSPGDWKQNLAFIAQYVSAVNREEW